ncbi:M4 family metallopeptidase [Xanthomonas prunicola]|uniref:M4 family metallopeptidase n=1 Tax=Xanthomonas prunicola TaxID=2053930 RepID=A0A9Q9MRP7_9XANT|nr:M4 family metallopeptidase [Xanthomonas prunicola]UXA50891.1 M4 family metallopeptidase [Xanthomonas prunicola]UXA59199.1 M4 family metallopeptidase [Xanthomonas prunicola]UXA61338.1 M4 family metallopeptidase [Xanthomonas prunicola]UXA67407.1 M4 family metallopeptidase [Xanthomonas prunicola]
MSAFASPGRAGILPPSLLEHLAQAASAHARQCAVLSRQITSQLRQQRALGLLARADAPAAEAEAKQTAWLVQRRIYDAQHGTTLPGTLVRDEGAAATQDQSAALNESVSDVLGVLMKQYTLRRSADQADWIIGAGVSMLGINGVGLRSMQAPGSAYDDPALGKDPQPATMAGYVDTQEDDGGVHHNAGIPNHALYRAAVAIGGAAWDKTGRIWYRALTGGKLAACADFATFAALTVNVASADDGAPSSETAAVQQAWRDVGVLA